MGNRSWISEDWSAEARDPKGWLPVNPKHLDQSKRERFERRKLGLDLYLSGSMPIREVLERAKLSRSELRRVVNRAFLTSPDGRPCGYLACIPGLRLKAYERVDTSNNGKAGRFQLFLITHPELKKLLEAWALGKKAVGETKIRGRYYKRIWQAFRATAEEGGIDPLTTYPFTNCDGGREAIRNYCTRLKLFHRVAGATIDYGDQIGFLNSNSDGFARVAKSLRPYAEVQLDGHRLDTELVVKLAGPDGQLVELDISRCWLIVAIDVASRAVLGYSISLSENYTSEDVLACIQTIYKPWMPLDLPTDRIHYQAGAGLPSGVIPSCAGRAFDRLRMDNAWSHHSTTTQKRIIASGVNEVVTNQPGRPRSDAIVERFMSTFEESTLHQFPTTTGFGPGDPRRRSPTKAAKRLQLTFEDLTIIVDVAISNYNVTPHTSLHGLSPRQYIERRIDEGRDFIRHVPEEDRDGLHLFEVEYDVTLRRSAKQAHAVSFKFLHVRYHSDALAARPDLACERVIFRTSLTDLRTGLLFLRDGTCLGEVQADIAWMAQPHNHRVRRAIFKLVRQGKLQTDSATPISDYLKYLAENAPNGRKERNRLLEVRRQVGEVPKGPKRQNVRREKSRRKGWISLDNTYTR